MTVVYRRADGSVALSEERGEVSHGWAESKGYKRARKVAGEGGRFSLFRKDAGTGSLVELSKSTGLPKDPDPRPGKKEARSEKPKIDHPVGPAKNEGAADPKTEAAPVAKRKRGRPRKEKASPLPAAEAKAPVKIPELAPATAKLIDLSAEKAVPMPRSEAVRQAPPKQEFADNKYSKACRSQRGVASCSECLRHGHCATESYGGQAKPADFAQGAGAPAPRP